MNQFVDEERSLFEGGILGTWIKSEFRCAGVIADALAPRVIGNSIVDQLAEEKFFEKFSGKELR